RWRWHDMDAGQKELAVKVGIDPEFESLIPTPPEQGDAELERIVLADGHIREPMVIWANHHNTLLDGHRRYRLTIKHPSLKCPPPVKMHFESRQEAHDWIIHNQLAKRNVTAEQRKYLIGRLYRQAKQSHGGDRKGSSPQVEDLKTAEKIGSKEGVS